MIQLLGIPIAELIIIFSIVVVVYLIVLEIQFKHLRSLSKGFEEEEVLLGREMRELRQEISELKDVIRGAKTKKSMVGGR